ncbi:MAG: DMT family transporter [Patescibacteria group bacterium]|nr:DMT family transporter [Patescibacteria group bacterium]
MTKRTKAYLSLSITALIWGPAFAVIKPSLSVISPFQFLYFRYLIAAPLTLPLIFYYYKKLKPNLKTILTVSTIEFFGTPLALSILYLGLAKTSALEASLIGATSPILATIGGIIFLKEKEERLEWIGLSISFFGSLLLIVEPLITGKAFASSFSLSGNLMIFSYNLLSTTYYLLAKKHYQNLPKLFPTSIGYSISLISFFIFLKLTQSSTPISLLSTPSVATAAIYMGFFGSIIALTTRMYGQDQIEASEASLFNYLHGVIAIPASYFLLKEIPTIKQIIAILVISFGVFIAEYRPGKIKK